MGMWKTTYIGLTIGLGIGIKNPFRSVLSHRISILIPPVWEGNANVPVISPNYSHLGLSP